MSGLRKCRGCLGPKTPSGLYCEPCKIEIQRLADLRRWLAVLECKADEEAKASRIDLYATIVANGGRIFEETK